MQHSNHEMVYAPAWILEVLATFSPNEYRRRSPSINEIAANYGLERSGISFTLMYLSAGTRPDRELDRDPHSGGNTTQYMLTAAGQQRIRALQAMLAEA